MTKFGHRTSCCHIFTLWFVQLGDVVLRHKSRDFKNRRKNLAKTISRHDSEKCSFSFTFSMYLAKFGPYSATQVFMHIMKLELV